MHQKLVSLNKIKQNPWSFRIISEKDRAHLVDLVKNEGIVFSPPVIAKIDRQFFIVDGHSRINVAKAAGIKKIECSIADWIKDFGSLRTWSFRLNRHGYSNPLTLSDMFSEDLKIYRDKETVARIYNVSTDYVESVLSISKLDDDAKIIIQKLITVASKKYQFLLEQITPSHIANLSKLSADRQVEVINWIFNDVIYGPSNESQISIPSILEIINEIEQIQSEPNHSKPKKQYKNKKSKTDIPHEIPFRCKCGLSYEIDVRSNRIFEYLDMDNMKVKKEFTSPTKNMYTYSSQNYSVTELKKIISSNWKDSHIRVVIDKESSDEDWK
ncbi:MAG: ParB N-terminal domain-containing protein [Nitrosopumilaceae archaeon]|nr:ParB N-terminal domain-containing protein [Nitrosopumilaceae archaeon]NIU00043.1 ParB N-terminal domain-containing protein [Nitrosopumilaceae archaeon]NIX60645.1 ParB N-terminal domain-containing protein [Nitrosopumilaceae archaeon]